jgi:hypothetical protein
MANPTEDGAKRLESVRKKLYELYRTFPDAHALVFEALQGLDGLGQHLEGRAPPPSRTRGQKAAKTYLREIHGKSEYLSEKREGHPYPYRCPKEALEVAVDVLAEAAEEGKWLHFDDVFDRFVKLYAKRFKERPADYPLRVILRFLGSPKPPLILREHAKYRAAVAPAEFRKKAMQAFADCPADGGSIIDEGSPPIS